MPKINARADVCVFTTVAFLQRCPKATVLEAMKVGGFSDAEIYDRAKQAWIYRRWKKSPAGTNKNDKPQNVVVVNRYAENEESLSSVTGTLTSGTSTSSESVTKKAKRVRMTGAATQSSRKAREEDKKLYNHAFKRATITYAWEKQKKGGLSAKGLTELIKNEFKVELCTRSIQKYVKNGCIGVSPQRRGPNECAWAWWSIYGDWWDAFNK